MRQRDNPYNGRQYNGWHRPTPTISRRKRRPGPFFWIILIMIIFFASLYGFIFSDLDKTTAPAKKTVDKTKVAINEIIAEYPTYDIGVSLIDTKNGEKLNLGSQAPFTAASTTKLITASAIMDKVEKGEISLETNIKGSPVAWHLEQLINQSNNNSWLALNNYLGKQEIIDYAKSIKLDSYKNEGNQIAPKDMAQLLYKLYKGKIMNEENTKMILGYMQDTNEESFIPAVADTESIEVFHKYGWLESNIHDVAILKTKDNAWVLAIYTNPKNNTMDIKNSTNIIHQVTEAVVAKISEKPNENQ